MTIASDTVLNARRLEPTPQQTFHNRPSYHVHQALTRQVHLRLAEVLSTVRVQKVSTGFPHSADITHYPVALEMSVLFDHCLEPRTSFCRVIIKGPPRHVELVWRHLLVLGE